jgi:hypothetical protein
MRFVAGDLTTSAPFNVDSRGQISHSSFLVCGGCCSFRGLSRYFQGSRRFTTAPKVRAEIICRAVMPSSEECP